MSVGRFATASTSPLDGWTTTTAALPVTPPSADSAAAWARCDSVVRTARGARPGTRCSVATTSPVAASRVTTARDAVPRSCPSNCCCSPDCPMSSPAAIVPPDLATCSAVAAPTVPRNARAKARVGASGALPVDRLRARHGPHARGDLREVAATAASPPPRTASARRRGPASCRRRGRCPPPWPARARSRRHHALGRAPARPRRRRARARSPGRARSRIGARAGASAAVPERACPARRWRSISFGEYTIRQSPCVVPAQRRGRGAAPRPDRGDPPRHRQRRAGAPVLQEHRRAGAHRDARAVEPAPVGHQRAPRHGGLVRRRGRRRVAPRRPVGGEARHRRLGLGARVRPAATAAGEEEHHHRHRGDRGHQRGEREASAGSAAAAAGRSERASPSISALRAPRCPRPISHGQRCANCYQSLPTWTSSPTCAASSPSPRPGTSAAPRSACTSRSPRCRGRSRAWSARSAPSSSSARRGPCSLSSAGEVLLADAEHLVDRADRFLETAARARRGEIGTIRAGIPLGLPAATVATLARSFRDRHPGVGLDLRELPADARLGPGLDAALLVPEPGDGDAAAPRGSTAGRRWSSRSACSSRRRARSPRARSSTSPTSPATRSRCCRSTAPGGTRTCWAPAAAAASSRSRSTAPSSRRSRSAWSWRARRSRSATPARRTTTSSGARSSAARSAAGLQPVWRDGGRGALFAQAAVRALREGDAWVRQDDAAAPPAAQAAPRPGSFA